MGRNKYPEQTVEQILAVSAKLFLEKGYEKTSVQDILHALGMSKGAIYHHFKSKEEILDAVIERRSSYVMEMLDNLLENTQAENAKEKLKKILLYIVEDAKTHAINNILSTQIRNPQFVVAGIRNGVMKDAAIIAQLLCDGKKDGSITTNYPTECAEIFIMLLNIWINPILFNRDLSETIKRLKFLQQTMQLLGVDIVSNELIEKLIERYTNMEGFQ